MSEVKFSYLPQTDLLCAGTACSSLPWGLGSFFHQHKVLWQMVQTLSRAFSALWEDLLYKDYFFFFFGANEIFSFSRSPVSRSEVIFPTPFIQPLPRSFLGLWRDVCSLNHYLGFAALGGFGVSVILLCFTIRPADFRQEGEACQKLARSSWTQMWDLGSCSNIALRCIETWRGLLSPHLAVQFRGETSRDSPKIEPGLLPS